jgi:phospholipid/cholesterol/gamma-HCH transport system substrate-binding protein
MRRIACILAVLVGAAGVWASVAGADDTHTYRIEMYNAFGIVDGSEVRVAGVPAGTVTELDITPEKRAIVTVELSGDHAVLGEDTECSSEPQSLIAEYFIDCDPQGEPLPEGGTLPASQVHQTVQNDLVLDTMRMSYRQRLGLLISEFGTALGGNAENLNEAIKLGAPALRNLHEALRLVAAENRTIRQLNVDSDEIIGKLAARSDQVVRFIREAGETAAAGAERREDLSTDFDLLDDALEELGPTMAKLRTAADETAPLLSDLRAAAPDLNELATDMPAFARSTERSLVTLGRAAEPGRKALNRGEDEIEALAEAGRPAPQVADDLAKFLKDIDDPRRAVEQDTRSMRTCDDPTRPCWSTGRKNDNGYTGMEGVLNYLYYQAGALNQFDEVGHLLHFSLYDIFVGPCGAYNARSEVPNNLPHPGENDTVTELIDESDPSNPATNANSCVGWLGPNQPGINEELDLPKYDPSVCPQGSLDVKVCDPNDEPNPRERTRARANRDGGDDTLPELPGADKGGGDKPSVDTPPSLQLPPSGLPGKPKDIRKQLEDLLGLPGKVLDDLGKGLGLNGKKQSGGGNKLGQGVNKAAKDLLDFLFTP